MNSSCPIRIYNFLYSHLVPSFIENQVKILSIEIKTMLEKVYIGPASYRYDGPGDDFLKSRYFFSSNNPWELGRNLFIYGLIAGVGYLLVTQAFLWLGYTAIIGAGFLILSSIHDFRKGNTLKKALELIVGPLDELEILKVDLSKRFSLPSTIFEKNWNVRRGVDSKGETVVVAFRKVLEIRPENGDQVNEITIRAYYFGKEYFRRTPLTIEATKKFECKNFLNGREIKELMDIVKN